MSPQEDLKVEDPESATNDSSIGEKDEEKVQSDAAVDVISVNSRDADEALGLVGVKRTDFSEEYNMRLRKKLDRVIIPLAAAVYFTQYLDKTSLNYASIMGFPITGQNYNLVALAFYVGFFAWEFPTTFISQKTRLAKYLGINVVCWGIVLMCHAIPSSFGAFFALRILLGMFESCVAPILILLIGMFYKKNEQGRRISWFYVMNGLTQIFGGFVAYGISYDNGQYLAPYKIIYILLGGLAIVVGIAVIIWMPDSPIHAKMLTNEEKIAAIERVRDDQGGVENKKFKREQLIEALLDIRTWLIVIITFTTSVPNGGLSNFSNTIIKNFGYSSTNALILSTPGGLIGALYTLALGWIADRANQRMIPVILATIPTIIGTAMMIGIKDTTQKGALLFAIYIAQIFGSGLAMVYAYNSSNISGYTKRVTINAMTLSMFCVGNIVGTEIFQPQDAPNYIPGKTGIMVLMIIQLFACLLLRFINYRLNAQKIAHLQELKERNGWTDEQVQQEKDRHAFLDMTDKKNPYFLYTI